MNPFDADVSLRPGNLYANLVLAESEQLVSAAEAIEKLSAAAAAGQDTIEDFSDPVRDISDTAVRKTVEENQDLRRQVVFLQQTVEERDRRIRALESLLVGDRANSTSGSQGSMNTATQVGGARGRGDTPGNMPTLVTLHHPDGEGETEVDGLLQVHQLLRGPTGHDQVRRRGHHLL